MTDIYTTDDDTIDYEKVDETQFPTLAKIMSLMANDGSLVDCKMPVSEKPNFPAYEKALLLLSASELEAFAIGSVHDVEAVHAVHVDADLHRLDKVLTDMVMGEYGL